jgi:glycosyltransferase involved in cell wall biosynthesis
MKPRVLIVSNLFGDPWNVSRGTFNQQQFGRLAERMDVTVLVPVSWLSVLRRPLAYRGLRDAAMQRWPGVDYVIFWYPPGFGRRLHAACLFLSLALQRLTSFLPGRFDCVMASWGYPDAVAVGALAALSGTPFVAKVHGSDINVFATEGGRRGQIRWALHRARHVIAVSRALAARVAQLGVPQERTTVLYNGVDPQRFHPLPRDASKQDLGYAPDERVLLFVGNVQASKGCGELLEAFCRLSGQRPEARLAVAGTGPQVPDLKALAAQRGCADKVRFVGRLPHEAVIRWFGAADLLCLPSHAEGVPNVVLEAMACGRPVVATDVGGIPEVLPSFAGTMVPPRDVDALEAALQRALDTRWDETRIVAHARTFDWERNVSMLESVLLAAAGKQAVPA